MTITTDAGDKLKTFRKPITFQKIEKRWYAIINTKTIKNYRIAVKHIKDIR